MLKGSEKLDQFFCISPNNFLSKILEGKYTLQLGYFCFNNLGIAEIIPQSPKPKHVLITVNSLASKYSSGILKPSASSKPNLFTS